MNLKRRSQKKKVGGGGRWNSERDGEAVKFLLGILFVLTLMRVPLLSKEASCNNVRLQTVSLSELGIKLASSFYQSTGVCQNTLVYLHWHPHACTHFRVHADAHVIISTFSLLSSPTCVRGNFSPILLALRPLFHPHLFSKIISLLAALHFVACIPFFLLLSLISASCASLCGPSSFKYFLWSQVVIKKIKLKKCFP